jgi:MurNAc alpha-1-phosphate uridylyltransferase
MILAAGLGKRMRPLTDNLPKPLLRVGGSALIEHQIERLVRSGVRQLVINHHYMGDKIEALIGDGSRYGAQVAYSVEEVRLETAGGIVKALPLLRDPCFVVVNADVWTDFPYDTLRSIDGVECLAYLVLVPNTEHHPYGDFYLDAEGRVHEDHERHDQRFTFSGISVLHRNLFEGCSVEPMPLVPLLSRAMAQNRVRGEIYTGAWLDIGTPERLRELNDIVSRGTHGTSG